MFSSLLLIPAANPSILTRGGGGTLSQTAPAHTEGKRRGKDQRPGYAIMGMEGWKDGKKYWDCMAAIRFTPDIDMGPPTPHCAPQGKSPARTTKRKKGEKRTKSIT
jgi:hypothetical protein